MNLSVIVVTYNAKDVTMAMYPTLLAALKYCEIKNTDINWEVINIDNGSSDNIAESIESEFGDWVKVIKGDNVGFSKGNNKGIQSRDLRSDYVLFINPDIKLEKDSIYSVLNFMELQEQVGLTTCRVDLWSGGLDWDCHRGFPTPWPAFCYFTGLEKLLGNLLPKVFGRYHIKWSNLKEIHEVDVCLGAYMMIRNSIGESINWWPEDYMLNGEDVDFCYQIKELQGQKIIYYPDSRVIHYKGASKGTKVQSASITKASVETKKLQINSGIESMEIFYKKYYKNKYPFVVNWIVFLGIWLLKKKRLLLGRE